MKGVTLSLILIIFLFSFLTGFPSFAQNHITIGIQDSIQQEILGQIIGNYLNENGFEVKYNVNLSNPSLYSALTQKQVDLAWLDPASVWFLKYLKTDILSSEELYKKIKELEKKEGLLWFETVDLENQYVVVMQREKSKELGITTISELADYVRINQKKIRVSMSSEFFFRPDCYFHLKQIYGFSFYRPNLSLVSPAVGFGLLSAGQVNVVIAFSTEPLIEKYNLIKLKDDKKSLKSYSVGIIVREKIIDRFSNLSGLVDKLSRISLSTSKLKKLNLRVYEGESPKELAREYLIKKGLIDIKRE
ncbi:MAG: glycine betaine ABC transporter substrate-binding protein [Candidatus Caldatribacteriota bacterium]|nr:glycine betaine ABC transporter substrate-binding protein [Candidatus Caldatribacteriota bacterium]